MAARVALCVEEEACRNPRLIGLEGESLEAQSWLDVYTTGEEARRGIGDSGETEEFWVLSCDDVEPINLAASAKSDYPDLNVRLVTSELCGSLFSRAHTAGIDEVLDYNGFIRRYADMKGANANLSATTPPGEGEPAGKGNRFSIAKKALSGGRRRKGRTDSAVAEGDGAPPGSYVRRESDEGAAKESGSEAELIAEAAVETLEPPVEVLVEEAREPETLTSVLQVQPRPALVAADSESRAFILTVVSGSGGAGKSAVSALGSLIASAWGNKTLLLDCDLQFGDVAAMVGAEHALCVDEAIARPERLDAELARQEQLVVLAAPSRLEASEEVVHNLPALFERASGAFEVIVVNTGASWAEQHAVLLERSSTALFLIDQRVSSVRACRHAIELCARCGIAASPFQYALNRCAKGAPLSTLDVSSALQGAPVFELKDGGRDVEDYLSGGAARELIETRNEFSRSLEKVMEHLLPGGAGAQAILGNPVEEKRALRRRPRRGKK